MLYEINVTLNGEARTVHAAANETLLDVLRRKMGIASPKCGCERGECGACTVRLNGLIVKSCLILAVEADGQQVTTLEGLMKNGPTPLQQSFLKHNAFQCGFCAPGVIMAAQDLLDRNPAPSSGEIKEALTGNLCRCTGYIPIIEAIEDHIKTTQGGAHG